ncbi:AI-2E family transporter [Paremcibacter congregatus]|uniref:AI-2E family transporter n=1 Tax=Paremcibacter congregatus TaxID=2043170 RepID=UPI0030EC329C|tara:strand:+ start:7371 stop:8429 length:1059 start_codon:yes stop_codon:yes gene_type:complete
MGVLSYAGGLGLITLLVYIMVIGRDLIVPFLIAVVIWYLINILSDTYHKIRIGTWQLPKAVSYGASLLTIGGALNFLIGMINHNILEVKKAAPLYQENFTRLTAKLYQMIGIEQEPSFNEIISQINLTTFATDVAGTLASLVGSASLILIYVLFLMLEQKYFTGKLERLVEGSPLKNTVFEIIDHISTDVKTYLGVKTFVSALTGGACYLVLIAVGVNNASFWAFVIFLLNFIPTVGSMLAVLFPALLSLVQFDSFTPFFIVITALVAIQVTMGNILEPKMMGSSLNLSPLVVMLSLALWGSIWGIAGMFLSVPFTVILMIIFAQFPKTKPIAILLSQDGNIKPRDAVMTAD